LVEGVTSFIL